MLDLLRLCVEVEHGSHGYAALLLGVQLSTKCIPVVGFFFEILEVHLACSRVMIFYKIPGLWFGMGPHGAIWVHTKAGSSNMTKDHF